MPPERTERLISELRAFYQVGDLRQKDLARRLEISPQSLSEILSGRNQPNAETVLKIQELLLMKPTIDPNDPKTLLLAKDRIGQLNSRIAELERSTPKAAATMPPAAIKPRAELPGLIPPGSTRVSPAPMPVNIPAPVNKLLPVSANTPYKIGEILKQTNFQDLVSLMNNSAHTPLQRGLIYEELRARRSLGDM